MSRQRYLAQAVRESRALLARYLKGFDDANHTKQAAGLPNHVAWTLGHLALVLNRSAEKLDGQPLLPASDFVKADGRGGNAERFDSESVAFASKPADDPSIYPKFARCVAIFDAAIERYATALHNATDTQLDSMTVWGGSEQAMWTLAPRMIFHNGTHAGQIADLRRALNMGTVLGPAPVAAAKV